MKPDTAQDLEKLAKIMKGIGEVFGPRIEAHQVQLFCELGSAYLRDDSRDSKELAGIVGSSSSAVSRNVAWFSERGRMRKQGLRMVRATVDQMDYRRKPLELTSKGTRAARALAKLVQETS